MTVLVQAPGRTSAVIGAVQLTPTHDGEAALMVKLDYSGGGSAVVQIDSERLARVMAAAGVAEASALVGRSWEVLLSAADTGG